MKKFFFFFFIFWFFGFTAGSGVYAMPLVDVEAAIGGWGASPGGPVSYKGDSLDLDHDLGYDTESALSGRLKLELPAFLPNIYLAATPLEYQEKTTRAFDFDFGDITVTASVPFESKLRLDTYDIGLYYGIPFLETVTFEGMDVELGLNVRIIDAEAWVEQGASRDEKSVTFPVPMAYIGVRLSPFSSFALEAEARGAAYGGDSVYSLMGRIKYDLAGPVFAAAGYRYDSYDISEDDLDVDVDFSGPFAEAGFSF